MGASARVWLMKGRAAARAMIPTATTMINDLRLSILSPSSNDALMG